MRTFDTYWQFDASGEEEGKTGDTTACAVTARHFVVMVNIMTFGVMINARCRYRRQIMVVTRIRTGKGRRLCFPKVGISRFPSRKSRAEMRISYILGRNWAMERTRGEGTLERHHRE